MLLILISQEQNIHYVSQHACEVIHDYNKSETVHLFWFMKNNLPWKPFRKFVFLQLFFMFDINTFSNRITETKYSHMPNGSQLTPYTVHFYSSTHIIFVPWKIYFPFKILAKLCFFNFFTFEVKIFSNKITKRKHLHLSKGSRLTSHTVHLFSPALFICFY